MLEELLREGQTLCLTVTGESMAPFLRHGRDQIRFRRPDRPLRRGDMAFFRRANGQYVMHRVLRAEKSGALYLVGDAQQEVEGPIAPQQVFAVVTEVCRKEKWLRPGCFWWDFFAGPWLRLLPLRPYLRGLARFVPRGLK
ncbi:MAG: S24/S26 family peptidase [Firmicutes bacterium]|nr:S24/S26 family peptidase [Bacillota bacterium]